MPPLEDMGETTPDLVQSPGTDVDQSTATGVQDATGGQPDTPPPSSGEPDKTPDTAEAGHDGPKSMAEAIEAALKAGAETDEGAAPADKDDADESEKPVANAKADADPDKSETVENDDDGEEDPSDEELAGYRPAVRRRIKKLLAQRGAARHDADELRPDAEHYRNLRQFMQTNDLQDAEVAELLQAGAHLKSGTPEGLQKFLDVVMPRVRVAMEATGAVVPQDLRTQVEHGNVTEEMAKQMARDRAARAAAEARAAKLSEQSAASQSRHRAESIRNATATWEQQVRTTDADFDMKAEAMTRAAQALVAEHGLPQTPEQALEYAKAAYAEVNRWFERARPTPKPTRPAPSGTTSASRTGMSPAPATLAEAIQWGLDAGARR